MAMIPVSHISETPTAIKWPWVIRCQTCGCEVARLTQEELSAMVHTEEIDPILCFGCEENYYRLHQPAQGVIRFSDRAPWPTVSVPRSLLGLV